MVPYEKYTIADAFVYYQYMRYNYLYTVAILLIATACGIYYMLFFITPSFINLAFVLVLLFILITLSVAFIILFLSIFLSFIRVLLYRVKIASLNATVGRKRKISINKIQNSFRVQLVLCADKKCFRKDLFWGGVVAVIMVVLLLVQKKYDVIEWVL